MRFLTSAVVLFVTLLPVAVLADPEREVRDAVTALARTSYAWETTVRQRFRGDTAEPRLDANAPVEVRGKFDPRGFVEITLPPSRDVPVPVTAMFREADVVAHTPRGWLRRTEMRQVAGAERPVEFQGKQVRLSRFLSAALKASAVRPLTEELFDLIEGLKNYRATSGLILADLPEKTVEQLWGDAQAKRAPEIQGTVIFKMGDQGLAEYHVVIAIGFPNSRTKNVAWSTQQWTTRISGIGSTTVELPEDALQALDK